MAMIFNDDFGIATPAGNANLPAMLFHGEIFPHLVFVCFPITECWCVTDDFGNLAIVDPYA